MRRYLFCALATLLSVSAQDLKFTEPVSGFLYDAPTRGIRSLKGIPGASYLGPAVVADVDFASISPAGKSALVWSGGQLQWIGRLDLDPAAVRVLAGSSVKPDVVTWSLDGNTAVLYSKADARMERWRGLKTTNPVAETVDSPSVGMSAAALSPDGGTLVVGDENSLFLLRDGMSAISLATGAPVRGIAFTEDGQRFYAVTGGAVPQLFSIRNSEAVPEAAPLAVSFDPGSDPAAIAVDAPGARLYVADPGSQMLLVLDSATGQTLETVALSSKPTTLAPVLRRGIWLLSVRADGTDSVLIADHRGRCSVYFVGTGN